MGLYEIKEDFVFMRTESVCERQDDDQRGSRPIKARRESGPIKTKKRGKSIKALFTYDRMTGTRGN